MLNAYTLFYVGVKDNENIKLRASYDYTESMLELAERHSFDDEFWSAFEHFNERLSGVLSKKELSILADELKLILYN